MRSLLKSILLLAITIGGLTSEAYAVTSASCSGATVTTCATYPTNYAAVGNIVIGEGANGDWTAGNGRTLVLSAPANFQFKTTGVTVANTNGSRVLIPTVVVTATTITVTWNHGTGGGGPADQMTIYGVEVRATAASGAVTISRTGGNVAMNGFGVGSNVTGNLQTNDLGATATKTFSGGGTAWGTALNWTPVGVPSICSNVVIPAGKNVICTGASTVNNVTIQSGGTLTSTAAITVGGIFTADNGGTYIHNNNSDPGTTIFAGSESFGATSTFHITNWNSAANPVGQYAAAFGHVIFDVGAYVAWDQDGTFAPSKIQGDATIIDCQLNWDDGTGATTALTIGGDVTVSGTGGCIFAQGADRNLTLVTGSFTHDGSGLAAGMYLVAGVLDWTVNGDISVSDDFTGIEGGGTGDAVTCNVAISGDFNITGGLFDWNRGVSGNMDLDVTGDINITGAPGWVRFNDGFNGALTVDCANFNIGGGADNDLQKGDAGAVINVSAGMAVTGGTTHLLDLSDGDLTLNVGGTFDMDAGIFYGIDAGGPTATGNIVTSSFGAIDFDGGNFTLHDGNNSGGGTVTVDVTNNLDVNFTGATNGFGIINVISSGFPTAIANTLLLDLDVGGDFIVSGNTSALFFTSGTSGDEAIDIVGDFTWSGGNKYINGSEAAGSGHDAVINIGGNATFSGGTGHLSGVNGNVDVTVAGNTLVSGGQHAIKVLDGTGTFDITGSYTQNNGIWRFHKSTTNSTADVIAQTVGGAFSHTGGTLAFDNTTASTAIHTLTLNGSSITLGGAGIMVRNGAGTSTVFGEIYVDPTSGSTTFNRTSTTHQISQARIIVNPGKLMDASGSTEDIQIAANDAADDVVPPTTIMLDIQGILNAGTKVIFGRAPTATDRPTSVYVKSGGEIQTANVNGLYNGTDLATFKYRTVDNTNANNGVNSLNWYLDANSRVTYNGSSNQLVSGTYPVNFTSLTRSDIALGTNAGYHYGILEIDHQGTIGTNYVYPEASNVFVRTLLDLDRGEFRLDGSGTGYTINIENPATTGITITGATGDAYVRSETNAGTNPSIIRWYIGNTTGAHVFPFGHSAGAANYVPFTFNVTSGTGGAYVDISTRASDDGSVANNKDNLPWESTVTNMYSPNLGQDGSTESVVDRWWQIDPSGAGAYTADITFSYRGAENTLDAPYNVGNIGAQRWDGTEWLPDNANFGSTPAVLAGVGTVTVSGVTAFSPWILSSINAPLPVSLLSFEAKCDNGNTVLNWATASETNNFEYIIYVSPDGDNYQAIGSVDAIGNSVQQTNYHFVDQSRGDVFYKLVQIDRDGSVEVLSEIQVKSCEEFGNISIYPNPSDGSPLNVLFKQDFGSDVVLKVMDTRGRLVYTYTSEGVNEGMVLTVPTENLVSGVYFVMLESNHVRINKKFIIK